jgi:hypothetical protein
MILFSTSFFKKLIKKKGFKPLNYAIIEEKSKIENAEIIKKGSLKNLMIYGINYLPKTRTELKK